MYKITRKAMLTPTICLMDVEAPRLAASAQPGQFLIVRAREEGERIPLTICDYDRKQGTVTIVTQIVGASSRLICALEEGDCFTDVVGPLGCPSDFVELPDGALKGSRYLFVAGGLGTAPVYPQAKYLHERGAYVDVVVGAKTAGMGSLSAMIFPSRSLTMRVAYSSANSGLCVTITTRRSPSVR